MWALLALGAGGCTRQEPRAPLTYEGSGIIAGTALPELITGYQGAGRRHFARPGTIGSSEGFRAVMEGRADVGGLSRSLKSGEKAQQPYYAIIGYDALAVFVHPDNPVKSLTRAQLKALFTGTARRWKDVGGGDVPVVLVTQNLSGTSGTASFFGETVMEGAAYAPTQVQPEMADCLEQVAKNPGAITWGSFSSHHPGVRVLPVDGVQPGPGTIRTADYPLSRPLVLVSRTVPEGDLKAFFDHVMSAEGQAVVAKHFVSLREGR
jgi:phosphate transport system substrate-binding protein